MVIEVKDVQSLNAVPAIVVTLFGIGIEARFEHPSNVDVGIEVILPNTVIDSKFVQPLNAFMLILVTDD